MESSTVTATSSPLRVAIVGTGSIAALHAEAIANYADAELVAAVDISAERAAEFAREWNIPATHASIDELLAAGRLDVVHVCTPPGLHAEQTIRALDAGAHVVVEKPPALSLAQLDSMTDAAARNGRELAVVFQQRSGTAAAQVRALLMGGAFGRPLVATCQTLWYRDPAYFEVPWRGKWATEGGGPTLGLGIHQIDLLAWLLGDWASVQGQLWRLGRDVQTEDVSTAVLTFANGTVASVITSALSPREVSSIRIDTEKATITVDHLYGHGHDNWSITPAPHVDAAEASAWALPEFEEASGHDVLLRDIYDALRVGEPLPSVAGTPARAFEIATALYSSAATGRVVTPETLRDDVERCASLESPVTDLRSIGA
ncbi:Gfo/Idh/MocA family oxidoreductase [Cryobacterium sp. Hz9]|nr:Gfo/Idh/MocA family oxidoreductase [Cryobacterium sp. Hz9]